MKRTKRTLEEKKEIVAKIEEIRAGGGTISEAAEQLGISQFQYYQWRKKYASVTESAREIKPHSSANGQELKQARIENQRLRMIVSDLMLDKQALLEYSGRK